MEAGIKNLKNALDKHYGWTRRMREVLIHGKHKKKETEQI